MGRAEYDGQGKLFHHYARLAGWNQRRIDSLLLKRYGVTHWLALSEEQKRACIAMMRGYAQKSEAGAVKRLRQRIMIMVREAGFDLAWLHERMNDWGYGESLRALGYVQTVEIETALRALLKKIKKPK